MASEIERKFLVRQDCLPPLGAGTTVRQGYLCAGGNALARIRVAGDRAWLTVKGPATGASRLEFEYAIPLRDGLQMLDLLCVRPLIEKTRFHVRHHASAWDLDLFHGDNDGLMLAEIELASEEQEFSRPSWVAGEVTDDPRYFNSNLQRHPFTKW